MGIRRIANRRRYAETIIGNPTENIVRSMKYHMAGDSEDSAAFNESGVTAEIFVDR